LYNRISNNYKQSGDLARQICVKSRRNHWPFNGKFLLLLQANLQVSAIYLDENGHGNKTETKRDENKTWNFSYRPTAGSVL